MRSKISTFRVQKEGPRSATKWTKNGVFVGGLRGVRSKMSTFRVQKVHFLGVPYLPRIDPGYGPAFEIGHKACTISV